MKSNSSGPGGGPPKKDEKGPQILTDRIKATEVRLITDDENIGVVSRKEAEAMAEERGLDLIIMSLDSSPPVVRLMDFGRFKFEREKKAKEAKKRQHIVEIKEIKLTVRIDKHDYEVKVVKAKKFIEQGHKVKVTIRLKGREVQHSALAFELAKRFVADTQDVSAPEHPPKMEGRQLTMVLMPGKKAKKPSDTMVDHHQDEELDSDDLLEATVETESTVEAEA